MWVYEKLTGYFKSELQTDKSKNNVLTNSLNNIHSINIFRTVKKQVFIVRFVGEDKRSY